MHRKSFHLLSILALVAVMLTLAAPALAAPGTITDNTPGTATNDGTVNSGEYVGFTAGINNGFGNVIGSGSQLHVDSSTSGQLNFGLIKGPGSFGDAMVIYIDSVAGGFSSTSTFNDTADPCRRAISGYTGSNRSILNFAPGFEADYAICMEGTFAGVWGLAGTGSHPFVVSANRTTVTSGHYELNLTMANIGSAAGGTFRYVATYLNPNNAFRSNEFHGVAQTTVPGGNPGTATVTLASGDFNTFSAGTLAVTLASFTAEAQADRVVVSWETVSEMGNAGFNLYRSDSAAGPLTLLAYVPSQAPGSTAGFSYIWTDRADLTPGATYYYWLEDVSLGGATTLHGPVSATVQAPTAVTLGSLDASPAATGSALPWLLLAAGAGLALGARRLRRRA